MPLKYEKNTDKPVQKIRFFVQLAFALLCIWIGVEFSQFIKYLESSGQLGSSSRPPGVEGFLPISALMSLYYFFTTGTIHLVHPAGFFIFIAIVAVSFLFGKSFCSWLCPVGFVSELIGDFGDRLWKKLFKKKFKMWRWLDYILRSLKYILLFFFAFAIFSMSSLALEYFLSSEYNIMSDVKMWYFFANISQTALIVIGILFFLSIMIRNFWCRFLCPYGALLGLVSFLSPIKIKRNAYSCIDCSLCSRACPSGIKVDKVITVRSDECTSCLNCIDVCPVANTLELKIIGTEKKLNKKVMAVGIILLFISLTGIGIITSHWHNKVPAEMYIELNKRRESIGHPTSSSDIQKLNKDAEERKGNE